MTRQNFRILLDQHFFFNISALHFRVLKSVLLDLPLCITTKGITASGITAENGEDEYGPRF